MRVLFLGATGGVGQRVVPLLSANFDLTLAALEPGQIGASKVLPVDIRDYDATLALLRSAKVDAVVNCAVADYRTFRNLKDPVVAHAYHTSTLEVNAAGAYHLYEAAARAGVRKFVFISSMTVICGDPLYDQPAGDEPGRPANVYACTKLFGEHLGEVYAKKYGMSVTCLRLGQPYPLKTSHDTRWLANDWARGMMVHMVDVASAIECALHHTTPYSVHAIVSASDTPWLQRAEVPELGYSPRFRFADSVLQALEPSHHEKS